MSVKENEMLKPYFAIFEGEGALYSKQPKIVWAAIEAQIEAGRVIAQRHLWDNDETLIAVHPVKRFVPNKTVFSEEPKGRIHDLM